MSDCVKNVAAVVTLFFPDSFVVSNVRRISEQVGIVVLSDNTPDCDNFAMFSGIANSVYIANKKNLGLSASFNKCMRIEQLRNCEFLIFFDQDSTVSDNQVANLIADFLMLERNHKVGYLGPMFFDTNRKELFGLYPQSLHVEKNCWTVPATITSSVLIRRSVLENVGFWNESVFLDYADLDLGWRLLANGYENFVSKNVQMVHRMGDGMKTLKHPFKNKIVTVAEYKPLRLYYQIRDGLKLLRKDYVPSVSRKIIKNELYHRLKGRLLFFDSKVDTLIYAIKALLDSIRGKDGEYKNWISENFGKRE